MAHRYKIAETPNEKGDRACYRFAHHECTMYDKSFTEIFFISESNSASDGSLLAFLSSHMSELSLRSLKFLQSRCGL